MLFETVPYLISGVPLKFSAPAFPISETRQIILTGVMRAIMRIINSNFHAVTISSQETALVSMFNLILDTDSYKPFLASGIVGNNSIITPSYSVKYGFSCHISLTASTK